MRIDDKFKRTRVTQVFEWHEYSNYVLFIEIGLYKWLYSMPFIFSMGAHLANLVASFNFLATFHFGAHNERNVPFVWRICTCACVCLCAFVFNSSSVYAQCVTLGHRQTMSATAVSPLTVHFVGMLDGFLFIISDNRITLPNRMSSCTTDTIEYTTENMQ